MSRCSCCNGRGFYTMGGIKVHCKKCNGTGDVIKEVVVPKQVVFPTDEEKQKNREKELKKIEKDYRNSDAEIGGLLPGPFSAEKEELESIPETNSKKVKRNIADTISSVLNKPKKKGRPKTVKKDS